MTRSRIVIAALVCLCVIPASFAAEPQLLTASGLVVKANPAVVILRPRLPDGQFATALTLKTRGTSKVTTLRQRKTATETTFVQEETATKELQPNQAIAVIYAEGDNEYILLSAVVAPLKK